MITVGTIRAMPPNRAMKSRDVNALLLAIFALLKGWCFLPTMILARFGGVVRSFQDTIVISDMYSVTKIKVLVTYISIAP
jgi:hypothetical protein